MSDTIPQIAVGDFLRAMEAPTLADAMSLPAAVRHDRFARFERAVAEGQIDPVAYEARRVWTTLRQSPVDVALAQARPEDSAVERERLRQWVKSALPQRWMRAYEARVDAYVSELEADPVTAAWAALNDLCRDADPEIQAYSKRVRASRVRDVLRARRA